MNLDEYGVRTRDSQAGIPLVSLLDKELLLSLIRRYGQHFDTASLPVAGSLFVKRYAVLTAACALDYYGLQQQTTDWWSTAHFDASTFTLLVDEQAGPALEGCWKEKIFAQHLTPMLEIIAQECKIAEKILWENVAVRLNSVFRSDEHTCSAEQLEQQYQDLTSASCLWLGRANNQLQPYLHRVAQDGEPPKRQTCCRYYQVSTSESLPYCIVCPLQK